MTAIHYEVVMRKSHFLVSSFAGEMAHFAVYVTDKLDNIRLTPGTNVYG